MGLIKFVIYFILFLLIIIFFSQNILNAILNSETVKLYIADTFNIYIQKINLDNLEFDPGYATTLYDFNLKVYKIGKDDFSIQFVPYTLNYIYINITRLFGKLQFKFCTGYSKTLSIGDTIKLKLNISLNYTLGILYEPFSMSFESYSYEIFRSLKSNNLVYDKVIKLGMKYYEDTIEHKIKNKLGSYLQNLPKILKEKINKIIKKYSLSLKIIDAIVITYYFELAICYFLLVYLIKIKNYLLLLYESYNNEI